MPESPELSRLLAHLQSAHLLVGVGSWEAQLGEVVTLHWSPEVREMIGWTLDQSPSFEDFVAMVHPDDRPLFLEMRATALRGERPYAMDVRIVRADGEQRRVQIVAEILRDDEGNPYRLIGAVQDRTEEIEALRQLRLTEVARRELLERLLVTADIERSRLARHLASGPIERLVAIEERMVAEMPDEPLQVWVDGLAAVRKAVESLDRTLTDIQAEPSTDDIRQVLGELAAEAVPGLPVGIDVVVDAPLRPPVRATLLRVVQEALHNVRKHARASRADIRWHLEDGAAHVSVSDDGRGFDVRSIRSRAGHLGLVAMQDRLSALGGRLELSSAPGRTVVEARLPVD